MKTLLEKYASLEKQILDLRNDLTSRIPKVDVILTDRRGIKMGINMLTYVANDGLKELKKACEIGDKYPTKLTVDGIPTDLLKLIEADIEAYNYIKVLEMDVPFTEEQQDTVCSFYANTDLHVIMGYEYPDFVDHWKDTLLKIVSKMTLEVFEPTNRVTVELAIGSITPEQAKLLNKQIIERCK